MARSRSSVQIPHLGGVRFRLVNRHLRTVYIQTDGEMELADVCNCFTHWDWKFRVERRLDCPIDEHKIAARQQEGVDA